MRVKIILFFWILPILCSCQSLTANSPTAIQFEANTNSVSPTEQETSGPFAIYLTSGYIPSEQLVESGIDCARLSDQPLLSAADIHTYTWETHQIHITTEAYQRLSRLEVPTSGMPFVICLGRHPVYSGALWTMLSSASFNGVTIQFPLPQSERILIELGYPTEDFFEGADPRPNPFICESLYQAGKLR